jgi:hypothetical protein
MVIMTVRYYQTIDILQSMPPNLLKKRSPAVYKEVGLSNPDLVTDTFPDAGKRAMITKNFENNAVSHYEIIDSSVKKITF